MPQDNLSATVRIKVDIPALKKDLDKAKREVRSAQKKLTNALGEGGEPSGKKVGSNFSKGFTRALTNFISRGGKGGMASIGAEGGMALLGGMKTVIVAGVAAIVALMTITAKAGMTAIRSFVETEKKLIRLKAVFKATGGAAGFSAKEIKNFAHELGQISLTPDNEILEAAAIIATFQNIVGENFKKAILVSNDLAIAMGTGQKSAALQLAKALAQPLTGLQSLREIGILFTDEQKDMIVEMNRAGKTAEAQNAVFMILAENGIDGNSQATQTLSGQLTQLENAMESLKSATGELIAENVAVIATFVGLVQIVQQYADIMRGLATTVKEITDLTTAMAKAAADGVGPIDLQTVAVTRLDEAWLRFFLNRSKQIKKLKSAEASAVQATKDRVNAQIGFVTKAQEKLEALEKSIAANRKRRGAQALLEVQISEGLKIDQVQKNIDKEKGIIDKAQKDRDTTRKKATQDERTAGKFLDDEIKRIDALIKKEKERQDAKAGISFGDSASVFQQATEQTINAFNKEREDTKKAKIEALENQKKIAIEMKKGIRDQGIAVRERADKELEAIREQAELRLQLQEKRMKALREQMKVMMKFAMEEFDVGVLRDALKQAFIDAVASIKETTGKTRAVAQRDFLEGKELPESATQKKIRENAIKAIDNAGKRILEKSEQLEEKGIGGIEGETATGRKLKQEGGIKGLEFKKDPNAANKEGQKTQITIAVKTLTALKTIANKTGLGVFGN